MWINSAGQLYEGDCVVGDREATSGEVLARNSAIAKIIPEQKISQIEQTTLMNRAVREFLILSSEAQAAAAGITPEKLYTANPAYRKVKDVDNQIAALRASI